MVFGLTTNSRVEIALANKELRELKSSPLSIFPMNLIGLRLIAPSTLDSINLILPKLTSAKGLALGLVNFMSLSLLMSIITLLLFGYLIGRWRSILIYLTRAFGTDSITGSRTHEECRTAQTDPLKFYCFRLLCHLFIVSILLT